jgi:hypothetical protein
MLHDIGFKRKLSSLTLGFKNSSLGMLSKSASIDELKKNKDFNGRCKYVLDICMCKYVFIYICIDIYIYIRIYAYI